MAVGVMPHAGNVAPLQGDLGIGGECVRGAASCITYWPDTCCAAADDNTLSVQCYVFPAGGWVSMGLRQGAASGATCTFAMGCAAADATIRRGRQSHATLRPMPGRQDHRQEELAMP